MIIFAGLLVILATSGCAKRIVMVPPTKPQCAQSVSVMKKLVEKMNIRQATLMETVDLLECVELLETGYLK